MLKRRFAAALLLSTTILASASPAWAQEVPAAAPPAAAAQEDELEEIIVTAQRRSQRLEEVPAAIVAVSQEMLSNSGVTNIHDLGRVAPGVQVNFAGGFTQPSIRGISTLTNGQGVENNVAIYIDGFYEPNTIAINQDLINLSGIEVLKGPQGTLYGRNATGGAILINTLAPSDTFTGRFKLSYGNFQDISAAAYVSGPISENLRFSVAGYYRHSEGYLKLADPNVIGGTIGNAAPLKQASVRTKLEADLGEDWKVTLAYNHMDFNDPRGFVLTPFDYVPATMPPPPLRATKYGTYSYNYETAEPSLTDQGTLTIVGQTAIGTLTTRTGYSANKTRNLFDFDGTYVDITSSDHQFEQKTFQQSVDLAVDRIARLDLLIGGMYYNDRVRGSGDVAVSNYGPGRTLLTRSEPDSRAEAIAVYLDASYKLTDALSLTAGGRYSREKRTFSFSTVSGAGAVIFPETERTATFDAFTPRASVRLEVAPRTNVYASYSRGFRSGSFNLSGAPTPELLQPVRPETIDAYEVGFKTARRGFRFDISGFYYNYKDLNVSVTVPNPFCPAGQTCSVVTLASNAPGAEVYGIDAQLTLNPVERLTITGGGAWLHARYSDFPNATGTGINPALGINVPGQSQDWSGQQMARAPSFSGQVSAAYTAPLADGSLLTSANLSYSDSYAIANPSLYGPLAGPLADRQRYRQRPLTLLSAQITWTEASDSLSLTLYGDNLTNRTYRATWNGGAFGDYSTMAPPRTYGVRLGYKY